MDLPQVATMVLVLKQFVAVVIECVQEVVEVLIFVAAELQQ